MLLPQYSSLYCVSLLLDVPVNFSGQQYTIIMFDCSFIHIAKLQHLALLCFHNNWRNASCLYICRYSLCQSRCPNRPQVHQIIKWMVVSWTSSDFNQYKIKIAENLLRTLSFNTLNDLLNTSERYNKQCKQLRSNSARSLYPEHAEHARSALRDNFRTQSRARSKDRIAFPNAQRRARGAPSAPSELPNAPIV